MNLRRLLPAVLLSACAPLWAATPASGELTDVSGPIDFSGGPFVIPNPTSDTHGLAPQTPLVCEPALMNCDTFALKIAIPDKYRKDEKNKKELIQIDLQFKAAAAPLDGQADFELYLLDSAGNEVASQTSGAGIQELISLPLSTLKDGDYTIQVVAYNPLGGSYSCEARLGKKNKAGEITPAAEAAARDSEGLLLGAFTAPALLFMLILGSTRLWPFRARRRSR